MGNTIQDRETNLKHNAHYSDVEGANRKTVGIV